MRFESLFYKRYHMDIVFRVELLMNIQMILLLKLVRINFHPEISKIKKYVDLISVLESCFDYEYSTSFYISTVNKG